MQSAQAGPDDEDFALHGKSLGSFDG
jgi:hypothetical protein